MSLTFCLEVKVFGACYFSIVIDFLLLFVLQNEHDKIRELSQQLAIEKKRAATYKRHLEMIFEQIEEHNESLSKKIQHIVDSVKEIEDKEQSTLQFQQSSLCFVQIQSNLVHRMLCNSQYLLFFCLSRNSGSPPFPQKCLRGIYRTCIIMLHLFGAYHVHSFRAHRLPSVSMALRLLGIKNFPEG